MRDAVGPLTTLEKINLAFAMTWAAGFVDLVGYVSLYGLYTSHMTGNTNQRWRLLAMLAPFALLTSIALYGVFRPFLALNEEW